MKIICIPGFWDSPDKFDTLSAALQDQHLDYEILDYRKYKKYGMTLNAETFAAILSEYKQNEFLDTIFISYSMGASFLYDYLIRTSIKPAKLIFVNPLLENVGNSLRASYYRILDMYQEGHLFRAIITAHKGLIPLMDVALFQQNYNRNIVFGKKLNLDATFVWSEKDLICQIGKYDQYKKYFNETKLINVPGYHHTWLVYSDPVKSFLIPEVKNTF